MLPAPLLSVVIPCRDNAAELESCLASLAGSSFLDFECIVVDDGSSDDPERIARSAPLPVVFLRTARRRGAAAARNLGVLSARGKIIVFLDADVRPHSDALELISAAFQADQSLGAVIGSYDDSPTDPGFYSQFRNLLHCYVHRTAQRQAVTFWTGCGAIRRDIFLENSGFDESYAGATLEDVDLGYRLANRGVKIELHPDIQVTHSKAWTFGSVLKSDVRDRGVPWTLLILRHRRMPNDLNVKRSQRLSVALACLFPFLLAFTPTWPIAGAVAAACLLMVAAVNVPFYGFLAHRLGVLFALRAVPAHFLHLLSAGVSFGIGIVLFLASPRHNEASRRLVSMPNSGNPVHYTAQDSLNGRARAARSSG